MILNKTIYVKRLRPLFFFLAIFCSFTPDVTGQSLISSQFLESRSLAQMQADVSPIMQNGVDLYKITYTTLDVQGQLDTASGLLVLPVREATFIYPLLCYQHGTVAGPVDVPSNVQGGSFLAIIWGAMGYVTAAPDYLGLGEARGLHPYVHADTEASAAIDMLFAVRDYADENNVLLNDQLFISGYSQGGHAAAAVHREIQENWANDFTVTASAPMSGPYNISGATVTSILSDEAYGTPAYMPYTVMAYDFAYGINYGVEAYFKAPYAAKIQQFVDKDIDLWTLNGQLFSLLEANEGASIPNRMLQDSIISIVLNQPTHPIMLALLDNDVTDWAPQAPTRLYYCTADDQVSYLNSTTAESIMNANGAPNLMAIDVDANEDHTGCVTPALTQSLFFFAAYQDLTVGNHSLLVKENISIFPNPANEMIRLVNVPADATIEIFDIEGQLQLQKTVKESSPTVAIHDLAKGLYLMRIRKGNEVMNTKLVVY